MQEKEENIPNINRKISQIFIVSFFVVTFFILYGISEKEIEKAEQFHLKSLQLSHELRQSSDDLTRMVRTYIVTKNPIYKEHYKEILAIRNATKKRPLEYDTVYWDLVMLDDKRPCSNAKNSLSLHQRMQAAHFTTGEFNKLAQAQKNSDALTKLEYRAMKLIESKKSTLQNQQDAIALLYSPEYHKAKYSIMLPIKEFSQLVNTRTSKTIENRHFISHIFLLFLGIFILLLLFLLWKLKEEAFFILGASVEEIHKQLTYLGKGNFDSEFKVTQQFKNSIYTLLSQTQTNLKELYEHNQQLSELYALLSQCNQAIVHSSHQEELFDSLCQDIVKFTGFELAWIGLANKETETFNIVSTAGNAREYLQSLHLSINPDSPLSRGPAGQAYLRGEIQYFIDFQKSKQSSPWHNAAKEFHLASSVGIPLQKGSEVIGVLTIYSNSQTFFNEDTKKLLQEMQLDINFALENFAKAKRAKEAQMLMAREQENAQCYLNVVNVMILALDTQGRVTMINPKGCKLLGYKREEIIGKNWIENFIPKRLRAEVLKVKNTVEEKSEKEVYSHENQIVTKSGEERIIAWKNTPLFDENGKNIGLLASGDDITQQKHDSERIYKLANHDPLTGLANRLLLKDHFNQTLFLSKRSQKNFALMLIDLDNFKEINDTLGHPVGDALLVEVANRFSKISRNEDTISRQGGDEFLLLFANTDENSASQIAQKLLDTIAEPFSYEGQELHTTISVGIAVYPANGQELDTLVKNADTAMYKAKEGGKNRYQFYTQTMNETSQRYLEISNALYYALERDEMEVYYQPQISTSRQKIIGAEALLRWKHPKLGYIPPDEFIPIAEKNTLIIPIGEWVLRQTTSQMKKWMKEGYEPILVAVNISTLQFRLNNIAEIIENILKDAVLPPEYLELELTERMAMKNPQNVINTMNALHAKGIRMSIDDFGTGYSSLSYLKKFKIYKLKIDQSFVRDITEDADDQAIVRSIISMAKSLGFTTIAEGVETLEQLNYLKEQGCDEIQGYYYAKPLPAKEFEKFRNISL